MRRRRSVSESAPPSGHDDGAEPDQQDQRLVIEPHADGAVRLDLAEARVDLAEADES